jgi:DNA-binding NarL/FixJ family response regulator
MKTLKTQNLTFAILDNHKMFASLLKTNIGQLDFVNSIHIFFAASDFFDHLKNNAVDILIVDVSIQEMNRVDIVKKCRESHCEDTLKIIMLSSSIEYRVIADAISFGANAYVTKEDLSDEIFSAIKYVTSYNDKPYFSKNIKEILLADRFEESKNVKLSPREDQLLKLICEAKTAKEIAAELDLSINTIHFYTKRLMVKMNVNRTPDLILKALNQGFVLHSGKDFNNSLSA